MSSRSKRSMMTALSASLLCSASVLAQEPAVAPTEEEKSQLELRDAPERQLGGTDALAPKAGGLTAGQVAKRAVASSPTLQSRQAEIAAADAKVDQTVAQFLPRLTLTATYRRLSPVQNTLGRGALVFSAGPAQQIAVMPRDPANPAAGYYLSDPAGPAGNEVYLGAASLEFPFLVDHYALNAQLALPLSDYVLRLSESITASRANRRAAEIQKRAETLQIAADARVTYYNWLRTVAGGAVAQSSLVRVRAMLKDARTAFELGVVTKADVLRLEAAEASTELVITETDALRSVLEEQLATIMDEPVRRYQVGEDVTVDPSRLRPPGKLSDLVAEAYRRRLEFQALSAASRSLRSAAGALRVSQYPRLDAFGDVTYANPNTQIFPQREEWNATWAVGLSLSWTINDAFSSSAQAAELDAMRVKLDADHKNLQRGVKLEVTAAYHDVRKARMAIETSTRGSAAAREAYRVARDLYQVGRATTTDLIEAESDLAAASLKEINAALDYHVAQVKLEHATGRDLLGTS